MGLMDSCQNPTVRGSLSICLCDLCYIFGGCCCSLLDLIKFSAPARNFLLICLLFGSCIHLLFGSTEAPFYVVEVDQVDHSLDTPN